MDPVAAATDALRRAFDAAPTVVADAPGRVNVVGGHTDHQEGFVLPVAIDRRTAVACRVRDDGAVDATDADRRVRAHATAFDETATFDLDALAPGEPRWADYLKGVCAELPPTVPPVDLAIAGDVPIGSGLSSSASLEVAVAGALDAAAGLVADAAGGVDRAPDRDRNPEPEPEPDASRTPGADVRPRTDREALALACWRAETDFVGLSCGVMDQFAATFGDPAGAILLDCRTREREAIPFDPDVAGLLVVETGVRHDLAGGDGYNDRVADCRRAVETLAPRLDRPVSTLRDVSADDLAAHADALDADALARARHVVAENDRVLAAADALRAGDYDRLGDLVTASHAGYRDEFAVSVPEADRLVAAATDRDGAFGARLVGGGFGGSVLVVTRAGETEAVGAALAADYADATGIDPSWYACAPAAGLRVRAGEGT